MNYRIQAFDKNFDANPFYCGNHDLDSYIRRYAAQDIKRNLTRVFVATVQNANTLAGFFTLSAGSVNCSDLPLELAKKLPRYPIPIALLGRLAVDKSFQGKGLGSILLAQACQKVAQASTVLAVAGIMVDAKDQIAASFYQHFGFKPLPENAERLFLPVNVFAKVSSNA
jgi:GNAT superfamily N-acetyltransferase